MGIRQLRKLVLLLAVPGLVAVLTAKQAAAVPSFARQTGQPCSTCHTMFPELKPFGRTFKLTGYVLNNTGATHPCVPPLAGMVEASYTHTKESQPPNALPPQRWSLHALDSGNDVVGTPQAASVFYGGQIYGHWGALVQATYSNDNDRLAMDMADIRYANSVPVCGKNLIYGLTFNNNPTSEDVWNSTPAWGFPYAGSNIAPSPAADVIIDNSLSALVGGTGAYAYWNNSIYVAAALYRTSLDGITAPFGWGNHPLGTYTRGAIPYWRLAFTHQYGAHWFEIGTYGLSTDIFANDNSGPKDSFRDVAFDAQYQYILSNQSFSVQTTWIHEDASYAPGVADNANDYLDVFRINGNYYRTTPCGQFGGSIAYFSTTGRDDATLYGYDGGNPETHGELLELDYMPPWHNYGPDGFGFAKFSLQYVIYNRFNGTSVGASANNTLYLLAWFMF